MTLQEARELINHERELYDAYLEADHLWIDRYDDEQIADFNKARRAWHKVNGELLQAQHDYPHLFAPFAAVPQ